MITSVIFDFDDTLNDYQSVRDEALRECAEMIDEQYRQPFLKFYLTFELSLFKLFTLKEISLEVYRHKRFLFPLLLATV
ncbi:MAG: hypothetical protein GY841_20135, partial [FCB group bacterium]|nr:hypothetical protein [FCB group bacterium]